MWDDFNVIYFLFLVPPFFLSQSQVIGLCFVRAAVHAVGSEQAGHLWWQGQAHARELPPYDDFLHYATRFVFG